MLKYLILLFGLCFKPLLFAQLEIIQQNNFDEANPVWKFSTNITFFDNHADGFFGIHNGDNDEDLNDTGYAINVINLEHQNFGGDILFVNDLNDEGENGTSGEATITFDEIELTSYREVQISFDFEIVNFGTTDYIKYQIIEDGITKNPVELPKNDLGSVQIPVKNSTKKLQLILIIKQNGQMDFGGIDNITARGIPLIPCNDLMISEYLEGTSSSNHRNNFIEIYNPTSSTIELDGYDLIKYTGKNIEVSASFELNGLITPYETILIEDSNEILGIPSTISTNNSVMDFTGDDKLALRNSKKIIDLIGQIGDSVNFAKDVTLRRKSNIENPNDQFDFSEWDVYALEQLSDLNSHTSTCSGPIPEIEIYGNQRIIPDGSMHTTALNNTYFGYVKAESNREIVKTFYIKNVGNKDLHVTNLFLNGPDTHDFLILNPNEVNIPPLDSTDISIKFNGNAPGIKTAQLTIENNDSSESTFDFMLQAEATFANDSPIMITQYYEGNGNNKWIEITNVGDKNTAINEYYLALYWNDDTHHPIGNKPSRNKLIPPLESGETIKFRASLSVTEPFYALQGDEIKTSVCGFTGDDIIVISTTNDENCWANRTDIIGSNYLWGSNISYVRRYGCEGVRSNTGFQMSDWLAYETLEIDNAKSNTNQRIENHFTGSTSFLKDLGWDNGLPDKYRNAIIDDHYISSNSGNIESCNLIINNKTRLSVSSDSYISINGSLTIDGNLIVENEGSLFMSDNDGIISNNGITQILKTTTLLEEFDYTYWSSPVKNAQLETVFKESPLNSFYIFNTQQYADLDNDSMDDNSDAWQNTSGSMDPGIGYTAMAPDTDPFIDRQSVIFEGELNNGLIEVPIELSANLLNDNDDWNFIGNPYPSPINANIFLSHPSNMNLVNGSIYFWTHDTPVVLDQTDNFKYSSNDYAIYNIGTGGVKATSNGVIPTGIIASCQGFFVEAKKTGDLIFSNEMRQNIGNDNFFKSKEPKIIDSLQESKIWLNLSNKQGAFSQILIGFLSDASESIESQFDAPRLSANNFISFYSIIDNQHFAIQGTDINFKDKLFILGFSNNIMDDVELTISIDQVEGLLKQEEIYLEDIVLKRTHNLRESDYSFIPDGENFVNNRFLLKFSTSEDDYKPELTNEDILILANKDVGVGIKTSLNSIFSSIHVWDLLGRSIFKVEPYKKDFTIKNEVFKTSGLFFIEVRSALGKIWNRKLIR